VSGEPAAEPRFARLVPGAPTEVSADDALGEWGRDGVHGEGAALNMIETVDGRVAIGGRSGPLGSSADHTLFHALRARAGAVMAGAGTVRAERYGPIIADPAERERRRREGSEPLAVIVSRSLEIDPSVPLLADPGAPVVVLTPSAGELAGCAARIEYVRASSLRAGLAELRARWGVGTILCEGGPHLNGALAAESLIDELFLSVAPLLAGDIPGGGGLVLGGAPPQPLPLELAMLLSADGQLFAHYVAARD
jgi:riboflavin biosynthesis pyrimidine reductase